MFPKCWKCEKELWPISDTSWRNHRDGSKERVTEFMCVECRVYVEVTALDFSDVDLDEDEE